MPSSQAMSVLYCSPGYYCVLYSVLLICLVYRMSFLHISLFYANVYLSVGCLIKFSCYLLYVFNKCIEVFTFLPWRTKKTSRNSEFRLHDNRKNLSLTFLFLTGLSIVLDLVDNDPHGGISDPHGGISDLHGGINDLHMVVLLE